MNDIREHLFSFVNPDGTLPVPTASTTYILTKDMLKKFAPKLSDDAAQTIVDAIAMSTVLKTKLSIAHFLAQAAHESGEFTVTVENLNYSDKGLLTTFGKYFPTQALAVEYARKPEKIGNRVYANRMGNGSEASGDGFKYRGRGFFQLTGKNNYTAYSQAAYGDTRLVNTPEKVSDTFDAIRSSIWYWGTNGLNKYADKDDVLRVSRAVNLGNAEKNATPNGFDDRKAKLAKIKQILGI